MTFSSYSPKNNKCLVYPYNYIYATNNNGENTIYKIEDFTDSSGKLTFTVKFTLSVGCSCKVYPTNYKGQEANLDEGLTLGKFPTFQWSSDAYTNWLTQNAINNEISLINSVMSPIHTLSSGNLVGGLESISLNTLNYENRFYQAKLLPARVSGTNTGDVNYASGNTNFQFKRFRPKDEYLKTIDDYFTRFGYKINRVKTPNLTGRRNFNYVEISSTDEIGTGNVPNKYWNEINALARRGVTIWHNHSNIGNYNVQNDIIS